MQAEATWGRGVTSSSCWADVWRTAEEVTEAARVTGDPELRAAALELLGIFRAATEARRVLTDSERARHRALRAEAGAVSAAHTQARLEHRLDVVEAELRAQGRARF